MQTTRLLCLLLLLSGLLYSATSQNTSYTQTYPAHIYRIPSNAAGVINGYLSWQGTGAVLTVCLLKGGMALNSRTCIQNFERADGNQFIFSYAAPTTDVYFLRVDLSTLGHNNYIKYTIRYMGTSPSARYEKSAGIKAGLTKLNAAPAMTQLSSSISYQVSAASTVASDPHSLQFSRYPGVKVAADTQFKSSFISPSSLISNFFTLNNEQACLLDISSEAGQWLFALDIETAGVGSLVFDIIDLAVNMSTNESCKNVTPSNVGVIVGSVIGSLAFVVCCIFVCKKICGCC